MATLVPTKYVVGRHYNQLLLLLALQIENEFLVFYQI